MNFLKTATAMSVLCLLLGVYMAVFRGSELGMIIGNSWLVGSAVISTLVILAHQIIETIKDNANK